MILFVVGKNHSGKSFLLAQLDDAFKREAIVHDDMVMVALYDREKEILRDAALGKTILVALAEPSGRFITSARALARKWQGLVPVCWVESVPFFMEEVL